MRLLYFAIFSLGTHLSFSQVSDSIFESSGSKARLVMPRLFWDYGKTATIWSEEIKRNELGVELLFKEIIQIVAEGGISKHVPSDLYKNSEYSVEGSYWRIGGGYLAKLDQINALGVGLRFAKASFNDQNNAIIKSASTFNDDFEFTFKRNNLNATWAEFVINSEKKLTLNREIPESIFNRLFSLGLLIRYRVLLDYDKFEPFEVFSIPGYGRTANKRVIAFNLFIKLNF